MGVFSTFFNSLIDPIGESVKTILHMYRMEGNAFGGVIFHRALVAEKLNNTNVPYISSLSDEKFLNMINHDVAVFIFILLMCESDDFNKKFAREPAHYFFKIETEVIKRLHTYKPNRESNYDLVNILSMRYNRFRW